MASGVPILKHLRVLCKSATELPGNSDEISNLHWFCRKILTLIFYRNFDPTLTLITKWSVLFVFTHCILFLLE